MRYLLPLVLLLPIGCESPPARTGPVDVNIESLYRVYRDSPRLAKNAWTGREVRLNIRKRDYAIVGGKLHWHDSLPNDPPVVEVEFRTGPPPEKLDEIFVVGTCGGRVDDAGRTGPYQWYILISDARWSKTAIGEK